MAPICPKIPHKVCLHIILKNRRVEFSDAGARRDDLRDVKGQNKCYTVIRERAGNDITCRHRGSPGERDPDDIYVRSKKTVGPSSSEAFKSRHMSRTKMNRKVKEVASRVPVGDIEAAHSKRLPTI